MAGNSRADILKVMAAGNINYGWGAIAAFNRTRLNRILFQQWLEKYNGSAYMPPFSGRAYITTQKTEYADLTDIVLGSPRLSFSNADFSNSEATLTLSILSGTYTAYVNTDAKETVLYSYTISEAHGYTVTVNIDLALVTNEVDEIGRVLMDLTRGTRIECNLAGPKSAREELGKYFQQRFDELPPHQRVFVLGALDTNGYSPLMPQRFEIRTQRVPGSEDVRASNHGDGAVVLFIRLRASESSGILPPKSFPYLIPDDQGPEGDLYSATLLVAEEFASHATEDQLALIHSLLFPGDNNVFQEKDREQPLDLAVFGNIDESRSAITVTPALHSLQVGGKPVQYQAMRDGKPLGAVAWSVRGLNTHQSVGEINPTTGLYTPVRDQAGKETVRNVVTAIYTDPASGVTHKVSALLLVTSEPMAISPSVVPCLLLGGQQPITFVASTIDSASVSWTPPQYGSLVADGNTAIYTPPAQPLDEDVVVQTIEAKNAATGESVRASVVLLKFSTDFAVTPGFTGALGRSATIQLKENDRKPHLKRRWTVFGEGQVSGTGLYSAPATFRDPTAVVVCELLNANDEIDSYGFSIVQLTHAVAEPTWKNLAKFTISKVAGSAYANGMQQMAVKLIVTTAAVDHTVYPLTGDEENSLRLVDKSSREPVPFLDEGQDGIEAGSNKVWQTRWTPNGFRMQNAGALGVSPGTTSSDNELFTTDRNLFVHVRGPNPDQTPISEEFAGSFTGDGDKGKFFTDEHPGENHTEDEGKVTLRPIDLPIRTRSDYIFQGKRVAGGGAGGVGRPTGPGWPPLPEGEDDFDYFLDTRDYWRLVYEPVKGEPLMFARCQFEKHQSLVKWESKYLNETMFSFTGYTFKVFLPGTEDQPANRVINYDDILEKRKVPVLKKEYENSENPVSGELMITLNRIQDLPRWQSTDLEVLNDISIIADLLDLHGNRHRLSFSFVDDNRNKLQMTVLS